MSFYNGEQAQYWESEVYIYGSARSGKSTVITYLAEMLQKASIANAAENKQGKSYLDMQPIYEELSRSEVEELNLTINDCEGKEWITALKVLFRKDVFVLHFYECLSVRHPFSAAAPEEKSNQSGFELNKTYFTYPGNNICFLCVPIYSPSLNETEELLDIIAENHGTSAATYRPRDFLDIYVVITKADYSISSPSPSPSPTWYGEITKGFIQLYNAFLAPSIKSTQPSNEDDSHSRTTTIFDLPSELITSIFAYLSIRDLGSLCSVSQTVRSYAESDDLWKAYMYFDNSTEGNYKKRYKEKISTSRIDANALKDMMTSKRDMLRSKIPRLQPLSRYTFSINRTSNGESFEGTSKDFLFFFHMFMRRQWMARHPCLGCGMG